MECVPLESSVCILRNMILHIVAITTSTASIVYTLVVLSSVKTLAAKTTKNKTKTKKLALQLRIRSTCIIM